MWTLSHVLFVLAEIYLPRKHSSIFYQQYTFVGGDPVKFPLTVCPCVPCLLPQQVKLQEQTAGHTGIVYQGVTSRLVQASLQF
jgi:hypothetical protein